MNETSQILNPRTPMAYMPSDAGDMFTLASYMMIGSLGAFLWDIFASVHSDYRLIFKHKISFPTLVYFFSRLVVLAAILVATVLRTTSLGLKTCRDIMTTSCVLYHVSFSSTTFLFYLRVRAIFKDNKSIVAFFALLWLGVVGGSMTVAFSGVAGIIGPTGYCKPGPVKSWISASPITLLINDTCVFLAVSWHLLSFSCARSEGRASPLALQFVFGRNLPLLPKALFQDGQIYYIISILTNVFSVIIATLPTVPLGYGHIYVFNAVIVNMMASRVYRRTKLGSFETGVSTSYIEAQVKHMESFVSASPQGSWQNVSTSANNIQKREWYQNLYSRILFLLLVGTVIAIPVACVLICKDKERK